MPSLFLFFLNAEYLGFTEIGLPLDENEVGNLSDDACPSKTGDGSDVERTSVHADKQSNDTEGSKLESIVHSIGDS